MGSLNRDQASVRKIMSEHDLLICVGSDVLRMSVYSDVEPLPETTAVVQIGLRDWELGKNYAAEIAIRADIKHTLVDLNVELAKQGGVALSESAAASLEALKLDNWSVKRDRARIAAMKNSDTSPMAPDWLMMTTPVEFDAAMSNAMASIGPVLIDVAVQGHV